MKTILSIAACVALVTLSLPVRASAPAADPQPPIAAFEHLKSLAGEWAGTAGAGTDGKAMATRATIRVVSAGSAVMITTDPGGPYEMVTMIHRDDGGALVATHYCSAKNQPRMRSIPGPDVSRIQFEFVDGTSLGAYPGRMQRLTIVTPAPDRQIQEWTYREGGKDTTDTFDLKRVR